MYGLVIGFCGKVIIHTKFPPNGKEPVGFLNTAIIGISGSLIGGFIEWLLHFGNIGFMPAGFVMSLIGSVLFCCLWSWYNVKVRG